MTDHIVLHWTLHFPCLFVVGLVQFLQCFRRLSLACPWFEVSCLLIYAEDDPNDADFDPDCGVASGRTAKQVIRFSLL